MSLYLECSKCGGPMRRVWTAHLGERYRCETCKAVEDMPLCRSCDGSMRPVEPPLLSKRWTRYRCGICNGFEDVHVEDTPTPTLSFEDNLNQFDQQFLKDCGISA